MNKKVFVVVPFYNNHDYVKRCIDSILNQTYKNIEIICVDDGSTDDSILVLKQYKDKRLKLLKKENGGVSSARNMALDAIDYKIDSLLIFVDADDWLDSDYIEKMVSTLEYHNVDIVVGSFFIEGASTIVYNQIKNDITIDSVNATKLLLMDNTIQSHSFSKIYKTKLWKNYRFDCDLFYMEDQALIYKVFYSSDSLYISNYAGYHYNQNNLNSATKREISSSKIISALKAYLSVCNFPYKSEDKDALIPAAYYGLSNAYLTLIPYYKKHKVSIDEKRFFHDIRLYIRNNHVLKYYNPDEKNNKIKKMLYVFSPCLYPFFFKALKRIRNFIA